MASLVKGKDPQAPPFRYVWELVQENKISDLKPVDAEVGGEELNKLCTNKVVNPIDIRSQEKLVCATAPGIVFSSIEQLRQHLRSEYHVFNLKRKMKGKKLLSLDAFLNPEDPARLSSDEEEGVDEVSEKKNNIDFEGLSADLLPLSYFRFEMENFGSVWSCILDKDTENS